MTVPPGRAGRISRRGLLATVVALGAATSSCTRNGRPDPAPAPGEIDRFAADWTRAVRDRDKALFDRIWSASADRASALWDGLASLGLTEFAVTPGPADPVGAAATLGVSWRVPGDRAPAQHTMAVPFEHQADRWQFAVPAPTELGGGPYPLWWAEPVRTHLVDGVCVIAGTGGTDAAVIRCAEAAAAGLGEAVRLTGLDLEGVVLELPSTPQVMDRVLGDDRGSSGRLSAVTWPEAPEVAAAPLRIVLNPLLVDAAPDSLRQVLTHEITHVITAAPERTVPLWVAEGYAELVGWHDDIEGGWHAAGPFLDGVRAGQVPAVPPSDEALTGAGLRVAYGHAWTLCRWLLEQSSWEKVNRWYAALGEGVAMDEALRAASGRDLSQMMAAWRDWVVDRTRER